MRGLVVGMIGCLVLGAVPVLAQQSPPPVAEAEAKAKPTEVMRKGRAGIEILIGTYLTLSRECKIGVSPVLEITSAPKNGQIVPRPHPINLRDVPGAPKRTCIGTSPQGVGVFYRPARRFRGEDKVDFQMKYPDGSTRAVSATLLVQ